ncbi:MAG TPA: hypothetical protein VKU19_32490 [Bryobacteraceae bacterium]|nr:hypothetical protein [Bryobacteraceae bacterium]
MVDFRRWIIAAAVLTLFAGLASAQVPSGGGVGSLQCTASVAVPPQLRSEGLTELIGDIVLSCTGGAQLADNSIVPTANITVSLGANVTSRILTTANLNGGPTQNISEGVLLIDEPGSGLTPTIPGTGPALAQNPCFSTGGFLAGAGPGGCIQTVKNTFVNPANPAAGTIPVMLSCTTVSGSACTATAPAANLFLGYVNGNQMTFPGIPVLPPVTSGSSRVYRMTNIRLNVSALGGGLLNGVTPAVASVSISGSTSLPVNNPVLNVGFIQPGLSTAFSAAANSSVTNTFLQCTSVSLGSANGTLAAVGFLRFSENFGTAFKTRVFPQSATPGAGQASTLQNIPGVIYNSESGFIYPITSTGLTGGVPTSFTAVGLADYGTRLKAVFNNIPTGVHIYVTLFNVTSVGGGNSATSPGNPARPNGNSATSFAALVNGETTPDANGAVGAAPELTATNSVGPNGTPTALVEILPVNGTAEAVWEVENTNPAATETFSFGVWTSYTANQNANSPATGTVTANMSYAPTPPAFPATTGAAASSSLTIPRFADTSTPKNLFSITLCQTLLLYPFVTNQNGFDTGLSIANTSTDPIGTSPQAGVCKLSWYDGTGKFPATGINGTDLTKEAPVATGTVAVNLASVLANGFQGYVFAQCNFQFAHGFAFVSDLGARNLAMGYLALVVTPGGVTRGPVSETLGN